MLVRGKLCMLNSMGEIIDMQDQSQAIVIRPLAGDREAAKCAQAMASSEPWVTLGRTYAQSLAMLCDPAREIYVALDHEEVTGFIVLNMKGAFVGYIQTVCVLPVWRQQGIGRQLIAFAEARIWRESPNVFMCVSSFNTGAQRLYQRLGYERIGELKDYIVAGQSEILLRKTIGPLREFRKGEAPADAPVVSGLNKRLA